MQINPGIFNAKITVQSAATTYNDFNEPINAWVTSKTVWAQVKETGSKELYFAQKQYAESTVLFVVRRTSGITAAMRVIHEGRTFHIVGRPYSPDTDNNVLYIPAKELI